MHPLLDDVGELKQLCMLEACLTDNIPDWLSFFFQAENVPDQLIINMDVDMEMEMEM